MSADDDADIRYVIRHGLERAGHSVVSVADGTSALAAVREHRPDVVILDVDMPGLTGLEVCRAIRDDPAIADTPVVIASGSIMPPYDVAMRAGASGVLPKPFTPRELRAAVEEFAA